MKIMKVLDCEKLFDNLEKCPFFTKEVIFLGYVMTGEGIKADDSKIEAIRTWPMPKSIHDLQSFHGLVFFLQVVHKRF